MIFLAIFACMFISFVFSGIESGVLSVNRARLRHHVKSGDAAAITLRLLLGRIDRLLITVVTLSTVFRILALALLYSFLSPKIGILGAAAVMTLSVPLLALLLVVLPKALFQRLPLSTLVVFAHVLALCQRLLSPFSSLLSRLTSLFTVRSVGVQSSAQNLAATVEIGRAASHLSRLEKLSPTAAQLIQNLLKFRDHKISSLAIPIQNVVHVRPETSIAELLELSHRTDIERVLVLENRRQVIGVIHIFDLLLDGVNSGRSQSYTRKIISVPSTEAICAAIRKMRAARTTLCAITEKTSGRVLGIATLESLLQRVLVGKVQGN